jgi:hypothetical protein
VIVVIIRRRVDLFNLDYKIFIVIDGVIARTHEGVQFFDSITIKKLMDWILRDFHAIWWLEILQVFPEFFDRWVRLKVKSDFHGISAERATMMNSAESGSA